MESPTSHSPIQNQTTNGATDSLAHLDKILNEYEQSLGLPAGVNQQTANEATRLLSIDHKEISRMSAIECGEAAVTLLFFSAHLQRAVNKEMARARWADESVKRIIASKLAKQKGYGFEERRLTAVKESDMAMKLEQIRVNALIRQDRIGFLAAKVETLAKALDGLRQAKRGQ